MKITYNKFLESFLEKSKDFTEHYDIDETNKKAVKSILTYFSGIDTKEVPLTKGLLIRGFKGSGKTMTFKIIQKLLKNFAINNSRDIVADYNIGGFEAINEYIKTKTRLFDDLGKEDIGKYYGNTNDVFKDIILRRYEVFQNVGLITHFTTNEDNISLEERYDEWAYDRLKAMCSVIVLGGTNNSRRNKYNPVERVFKKEPVLSKEEIEKLNLISIKNTANKIIEGDQTLYNSMYVDVYDWLKRNNKINLSRELRAKITIEAEKTLLNERDIKITKAMSNGDLTKAKNLTSKMFDINSDIVFYQKKTAVIKFLNDNNELGITIDKIFNTNSNDKDRHS